MFVVRHLNQYFMESQSKEAHTLLAIAAFKRGSAQSVKKLAHVHNVPRMTLTDRIKGRASRIDSPVNSRKLDFMEEEVIIRKVLELYSRVFPPRFGDIEEMANQLRMIRDASRVGPRWA